MNDMDARRIDRAILSWIATKSRLSDSRETKKKYTEVINAFRAWLQKTGLDLDPTIWEGVSTKEAVATIAAEAQLFANHSKRHPGQDVAQGTYAQRLSILASFYAFANKRDFIECVNPISKLDRPHLNPYGKVEPLDIESVVKAMQAIDRETPHGLRDYTLLGVLLQTGRRLAEVEALRCRHIKLSKKLEELRGVEDIRLTLQFERCKGGKTATHELSTYLSIELLKSLKLSYGMDLLLLDGARPLWPVLYGEKPLGRRGIAYVVDKRLGTTSVHRLRHTNAVVLRKLGMSLEEIQGLMGHEHLNTTAVYLQAVLGTQNKKVDEVDKMLLGS